MRASRRLRSPGSRPSSAVSTPWKRFRLTRRGPCIPQRWRPTREAACTSWIKVPFVSGRLIGRGRVSTVAGSGLLGYSGDWGPATSARLGNRVEGLVVDGEGNVYRAGTVAPNPAGGCIGNNHHVRRHGRIGRGRRRRACHRGRAQRALSSARLAAARRSRCPGLLATALSQSRR